MLGEILEVADDARLEGRKSLIDHEAVVQSAGTIRRITHRLATNAVGDARFVARLDDITEAAHDAMVVGDAAADGGVAGVLSKSSVPQHPAAMALAASHSRDQIAGPLAGIQQPA